jgi:serine protease AprX
VTVGALGDQQTILNTARVAQTQDQQALGAGRVDVETRTFEQQELQNAQALRQSAGLPAPWSSGGATQDGFTKPDIYGPGRFITAPLAPGSAFATTCPECVVNGHYIMASGTSLASPIVAGAVAQLLQAHPDWTPDMVKGALVGTTTPPPGYAPGSPGLLDANGALSAPANLLTANQGLTPNSLVVTSGDTPTWSNWNRSSWSTAEGAQSAPWARSSWSCTCSGTSDNTIDTTRSSWSTLAWTIDFSDVISGCSER